MFRLLVLRVPYTLQKPLFYIQINGYAKSKASGCFTHPQAGGLLLIRRIYTYITRRLEDNLVIMKVIKGK